MLHGVVSQCSSRFVARTGRSSFVIRFLRPRSCPLLSSSSLQVPFSPRRFSTSSDPLQAFPPSVPDVRLNEDIRYEKVRVVSKNDAVGKGQLGIMSSSEALALARSHSLDLVEKAVVGGDMPLVFIMDYKKHVYEEKIKDKEMQQAQKKSMVTEKVIQFRERIEKNDLLRKVQQARDFLDDNHSVRFQVLAKKVTAEEGEPMLQFPILRMAYAELLKLAIGDAAAAPRLPGAPGPSSRSSSNSSSPSAAAAASTASSSPVGTGALSTPSGDPKATILASGPLETPADATTTSAGTTVASSSPSQFAGAVTTSPATTNTTNTSSNSKVSIKNTASSNSSSLSKGKNLLFVYNDPPEDIGAGRHYFVVQPVSRKVKATVGKAKEPKMHKSK